MGSLILWGHFLILISLHRTYTRKTIQNSIDPEQVDTEGLSVQTASCLAWNSLVALLPIFMA